MVALLALVDVAALDRYQQAGEFARSTTSGSASRFFGSRAQRRVCARELVLGEEAEEALSAAPVRA